MPKHTGCSRCFTGCSEQEISWISIYHIRRTSNARRLKITLILICFLSGAGQERAACEDTLPGHQVHAAVHQELLPVGERSEEPHRLPGDVAINYTVCISFFYSPSSVSNPRLNSHSEIDQRGAGLSRNAGPGLGSVLGVDGCSVVCRLEVSAGEKRVPADSR